MDKKIEILIYVFVGWMILLLLAFGLFSSFAEQEKQNYITAYNQNVSFHPYNNNSCSIVTNDCIVTLESVYKGSINTNLANYSYCSESPLNQGYFHGLNITNAQFNNTDLNASFYSGNCVSYGKNPYASFIVIVVGIIAVVFVLGFGIFLIAKAWKK